MKYDKARLINLNDDISRYEIFEIYGNGVIEDPYRDKQVVLSLECTEFEAWIMAESMEINHHGTITKRTSWENPHYCYDKAK